MGQLLLVRERQSLGQRVEGRTSTARIATTTL